MAAFDYIALDQNGKESKGVSTADSPKQVRNNLREQGLIPLSINEVVSGKSTSSKQTRGIAKSNQTLKTADLSLITRQLATLIQAGLPLEEALDAAANQSESSKVQSMLSAIRSRVLEGHSLASGLDEFPRAFPAIYRATISIGEHSGHLDALLERLADYAEKRQYMKQKISAALNYPVVLTVLSFAVIGILLTFVVPKVVGVYKDNEQALPGITQTMLSMSDFMQNYWYIIILSSIAGIVGFKHWLKNENNLFKFHRFALTIPGIKRLIRATETARCTRTLSILFASGVPVIEAMKIGADVVQNRLMRQAINNATARVREGTSLSAALSTSKLFPPITLNLIASGENTGRLDDMLERAAEQQENELESRTTTLLNLFEPALVVVMGLIVFLIVLATLLPIIDYNQLVQ